MVDLADTSSTDSVERTVSQVAQELFPQGMSTLSHSKTHLHSLIFSPAHIICTHSPGGEAPSRCACAPTFLGISMGGNRVLRGGGGGGGQMAPPSVYVEVIVLVHFSFQIIAFYMYSTD